VTEHSFVTVQMGGVLDYESSVLILRPCDSI